ncbi:MAG: glycoside hydrolase family 65 protein [Chitinivibrionales bacterium]|nr:glycoside hydrolase family 65 protein [Chitinivibrionales bacterium]MBD3357936.1 glycoside hydrolase family 65 protein [Chitinivibrionales bacterium]
MSDQWVLTYDTWSPREEPVREALCTLGNGYFATRGAAEESTADRIHYPGTYLAGGYDRLASHVDGRMVENEDLVNWPNWLSMSFRVNDGTWFRIENSEVVAFKQSLDMRSGELNRHVLIRDTEGRMTLLDSSRIVHMSRRHIGALRWRIVPRNWSGTLTVRSAIDGTVENSGVERYRDLRGNHLVALGSEGACGECTCLVVRTKQSQIRAAIAARLHVDYPTDRIKRKTHQTEGYISQEVSLEVEVGQEATFEKVVAIHTSKDVAMSEPSFDARKEVQSAPDYEQLRRSHARAWEHLWKRCDLSALVDAETQLVLRLHIFHILQVTSLNLLDVDAGVPARGLHGEAYRGHVLWDELFIFPFLNFRMPVLTRELLLYRYRRMAQARRAAHHAGFRGVMFPWQSGSNGKEESQTLHLNPASGRWIPDNTHLQRHVNAAIAYNVWQYYQVTEDTEFMCLFGAEMILEIARFLASLTEYNPSRDRYEIHNVVGPDEYHTHYPGADSPGINNNAYTNLMTAWVLFRADDVLSVVDDQRRAELIEALEIDKNEPGHWRAIAERMFIPFDDAGHINQFEGYEKLRELDWEDYRRRFGDNMRLDRILEKEGDDVNRYKVGKQADVLMLFYLFSAETLKDLFNRLSYSFDPRTIHETIAFYAGRTSNGSTLSRLVHSWVLARSDRGRSWREFRRALIADFRDVQGGTTPEGIHLGAMAGTVDLVQRGYTGLEIRNDTLWFNPRLPEDIGGLRLRLRFRSHHLSLELDQNSITVRGKGPANRYMKLGLGGEVYKLKGEWTKSTAIPKPTHEPV